MLFPIGTGPSILNQTKTAAMTMNALCLTILPENLTICRFPACLPLPLWAADLTETSLLSITRTQDELSLVAESKLVPKNVQAEHGWRAIKVVGPLDFALIGILASLAGTLAQAGVSLFALSTFDTDYLLVKEDVLTQAIRALRRAGHLIEEAV